MKSRRFKIVSEGGVPARRANNERVIPVYRGNAREATRPIKNRTFVCWYCRKPFIVETTNVGYCSTKCNHDANP